MSFSPILHGLIHRIQLQQVQAFDAKVAEDREAARQLRMKTHPTMLDVSELLSQINAGDSAATVDMTQEQPDEQPQATAVSRGDIPPPPISGGE